MYAIPLMQMFRGHNLSCPLIESLRLYRLTQTWFEWLILVGFTLEPTASNAIGYEPFLSCWFSQFLAVFHWSNLHGCSGYRSDADLIRMIHPGRTYIAAGYSQCNLMWILLNLLASRCSAVFHWFFKVCGGGWATFHRGRYGDTKEPTKKSTERKANERKLATSPVLAVVDEHLNPLQKEQRINQ